MAVWIIVAYDKNIDDGEYYMMVSGLRRLIHYISRQHIKIWENVHKSTKIFVMICYVEFLLFNMKFFLFVKAYTQNSS